MKRRIIAALTVALALVVGVGLATAAKQKPKNGNFEAGDLSHWHVTLDTPSPTFTWSVYSGTKLPQPGPTMRRRGGPPPTTFFAPPQGEFGAVTVGAAGLKILHRKLKLAEDSRHKLKLWVYYHSYAPIASPDDFEWDGPGTHPNQQYRVDLLRKNAPIDSVDESDVLKEVFATETGDPESMGPTKLKVNLTKFAGKKVQLRFAEVDNQFYFNAGVDGVKLKSKPKK
jgi:hypothetical protein